MHLYTDSKGAFMLELLGIQIHLTSFHFICLSLVCVEMIVNSQYLCSSVCDANGIESIYVLNKECYISPSFPYTTSVLNTFFLVCFGCHVVIRLWSIDHDLDIPLRIIAAEKQWQTCLLIPCPVWFDE